MGTDTDLAPSFVTTVNGVDVQYRFDPHPRRFHLQFVNVKPFLMDVHPVSQGDFATYLAANPSAIPTDTWHYLKNWDWGDGVGAPVTPTPGNSNLPVTYLGLDEARAYCSWAGKRLPSDIEWQYAAQGGITGQSDNSVTHPFSRNTPLLPRSCARTLIGLLRPPP